MAEQTLEQKIENDYVIRVLDSPLEVDAAAWNTLLQNQANGNPFMRHEYLAALHTTGAAVPATGWTPRFITLWRNPGLTPQTAGELVAACPLYVKTHSYGEYVFDWAWANAYQQHGLDYYPKAVVAVPFTPVPGARLLARTLEDRQALASVLVAWCGSHSMSSLHVLFGNEDDMRACADVKLMLRHTVQFHWTNVAPTLPASRGSLPPEGARFPRGGPSENMAPTLPASRGSLPPEGVNFSRGGPSKNSASSYSDFDEFLATLAQDKRKKIRQERRKVAEAGVSFRWSLGRGISGTDWDFFYRCYERTYLEHGNAPYLGRSFFQAMAETLPDHWLLFVATQNGQPIASSLIAVQEQSTIASGQFSLQVPANHHQHPNPTQIAYGRYWGALKRVDCLHFEACYYQPLQWCIENGYQRFEGGAQGEHKMARALMPVKTHSAHWLAHPAFADAVERFLAREGAGIDGYLDDLAQRSPFRTTQARAVDRKKL